MIKIIYVRMDNCTGPIDAAVFINFASFLLLAFLPYLTPVMTFPFEREES